MPRRTTSTMMCIVACAIGAGFFAKTTGSQARLESISTQNLAQCQQKYDSSAMGSESLQKIENDWTNGKQETRVVGGDKAKIQDNPWQVAILAARVPLNLYAQFCGGSLLTKRWVLTAAHCVDNGTDPARVSILGGTASLIEKKPRVLADRIIVHCDWNPSGHDSDIALIHVVTDLVGPFIEPIDENEAGLSDGVMVRVSGWGLLSISDSTRTADLYQTDVPYVPKAKCTLPKSYPKMGEITDNMLCAGKEGKDTCTGDSGGPASIAVDGKGTRRLVGIASWGDGCGQVNKPGVYTRISRFRPWVKAASGNDIGW